MRTKRAQGLITRRPQAADSLYLWLDVLLSLFTILSKFSYFPSPTSRTQLGSGSSGLRTLRPLDGSSARWIPVGTSSPAGYSPPPKTYPSSPACTRHMGGLDERPLARAPVAADESSKIAILLSWCFLDANFSSVFTTRDSSTLMWDPCAKSYARVTFHSAERTTASKTAPHGPHVPGRAPPAGRRRQR